MEIRKALLSDVSDILRVMDSARLYQRSLGFQQWEDGYPNESIITEDINRDSGYVLTGAGVTAGYVCLVTGDSAYKLSPSPWQYMGEYAVVHRLAMDDTMRGRGMSKEVFSLIERKVRALSIPIIRVDTGTANVVMNRLLAKYGYINCGVHRFPWGERIAYEKLL